MTNKINEAKTYIELSLHECGREECIATKKFHFSVKKYHLFHYVLKGRGTYVLNNKSYQIKEGMIFYTPIGSEPIYYPDPNDPWTYIWLGFDGTNSNEILKECSLSYENPIYIDKNHILSHYFQSLYEGYRKRGELDMYCLGCAYQIFSLMIDTRQETKIKELNSKEKYSLEVKEFIENNYQFDIKINDIAKSVGISPNYLTNIFTEVNQMSPKTYLIDVRMDKALQLLKSRKLKIKDVSELVGYKNQLHFSNEFKRKYGLSPLNFIRELENEENN